MNVAVFGTGMVGKAVGSKIVQLRHRVKMGSRSASNPKAVEWARASGPNASHGTFSEAAAFGEILFNCTAGTGTLDALKLAGDEHLRGKILIDLANPLDFSEGMPPTLFVCNTDSLGEQVQRAFPELRVVKTLNTVNCDVMVKHSLVPGDHDLFVCGNDASAKSKVMEILKTWFGWESVIDLGDISNARATEAYLPIWLRLYGILGTTRFNIKVVR